MEKQIFELSIMKLIQQIKNLSNSGEKIRVLLKRRGNIVEYIIYINDKKTINDNIKLLDNNGLKIIYKCLKQSFFDNHRETYKINNNNFNIKIEISTNVSIDFDSRSFSDKKWFNEQAINSFQKVKRK